MNATYLFKEETTNGQKRLRIGTRAEYEEAIRANKSLGVDERRYFIREKSLDRDHPDVLIIEVDRAEYEKWHRENNARCRNVRAAKQYKMFSLEAMNKELCNEGEIDQTVILDEGQFEEILTNVCLDDFRKELKMWRSWAPDLLDVYLKGQEDRGADILSEKYGVSKQTTRKYVRQFEQRLKNFLEGVSF